MKNKYAYSIEPARERLVIYYTERDEKFFQLERQLSAEGWQWVGTRSGVVGHQRPIKSSKNRAGYYKKYGPIRFIRREPDSISFVRQFKPEQPDARRLFDKGENQ